MGALRGFQGATPASCRCSQVSSFLAFVYSSPTRRTRLSTHGPPEQEQAQNMSCTPQNRVYVTIVTARVGSKWAKARALLLGSVIDCKIVKADDAPYRRARETTQRDPQGAGRHRGASARFPRRPVSQVRQAKLPLRRGGGARSRAELVPDASGRGQDGDEGRSGRRGGADEGADCRVSAPAPTHGGVVEVSESLCDAQLAAEGAGRSVGSRKGASRKPSTRKSSPRSKPS